MVWDKGVVRASTALAHGGSVSTVQVVRGSNRLVTCGYDKLIKLWEPGRGPRAPAELCALSGHPAPVMTCKAQQSTGFVVSGDRSGNVGLWDVEGGACSNMYKSAHSGHVTCLAWGSNPEGMSGFPPSVFASGGQDGVLRVRLKQNVFSRIHVHTYAYAHTNTPPSMSYIVLTLTHRYGTAAPLDALPPSNATSRKRAAGQSASS